MVRNDEKPRLLVPVDGSDSSDAAVEKAAELALALNAGLDILYVSYFDSSTDAEEDSWLPDIVSGAVGEEQRSVIERAMSHVPEGVDAKCWQRTGNPAAEIMKLAEELHSCLIVIGGRGLGLMEGLLLGSVSHQIIEESKISVLVVKAGEHLQPPEENKEQDSFLPDFSGLSRLVKSFYNE